MIHKTIKSFHNSELCQTITNQMHDNNNNKKTKSSSHFDRFVAFFSLFFSPIWNAIDHLLNSLATLTIKTKTQIFIYGDQNKNVVSTHRLRNYSPIEN